MWTQQEIILARDLDFVCGSGSIAFSRLIRFVYGCSVMVQNTHRSTKIDLDILSQLRETLINVKKCMMVSFREIWGPQKQLPSLLSLLVLSEQCRATDPRDKLYALLAIDRGKEIPIEPNYDLSTARVYSDFVRLVALRDSRLLLYGSNGIGAERFHDLDRVSGLPSWATDFTQPRLRMILEGNFPWGAAGDLPAKASFSKDGLVLKAEGLIVDLVEAYELEQRNNFLKSNFWDLCFKDEDETYPTGIPRVQAYFRTLIFAKPGAANTEDEVFFQLAAGFMHAMSVNQNSEPELHTKFLDFLGVMLEGFDHSSEEIWEVLMQYGEHVPRFLWRTGAVEHLETACFREGGLEGIADFSEQDFLEGFCGSKDSPQRLE
jgi:hypothetical protein